MRLFLGRRHKITLFQKKKNIREVGEPNQDIQGHVEYAVRRWHNDPNGPIVKNGLRGYYDDEFTPIGGKYKIFKNLLNTDGRDVIHNDMYITTSRVADGGANRIALTTDTGAPAAGDTVLTSEITTGGLARIQATTRTHTDNTNVSTVEHTFTATTVHTAVVKSGLFNAISGVTLVHENTFTTVTLQINDELKVTWTITAG